MRRGWPGERQTGRPSGARLGGVKSKQSRGCLSCCTKSGLRQGGQVASPCEAHARCSKAGWPQGPGRVASMSPQPQSRGAVSTPLHRGGTRGPGKQSHRPKVTGLRQSPGLSSHHSDTTDDRGERCRRVSRRTPSLGPQHPGLEWDTSKQESGQEPPWGLGGSGGVMHASSLGQNGQVSSQASDPVLLLLPAPRSE